MNDEDVARVREENERLYAKWVEDLRVQYVMTGNALYVWSAARLCRGRVFPAWVFDYIDRVAANIEQLTWDPEVMLPDNPARAIAEALEMSPNGPSVFRKEYSGDRRSFRYVEAVEACLAQGDKLSHAITNAATRCRVSESTIKRAWRDRVRVSRETVNPKT